MDLALDPGDLGQSLAKIYLRMTRIVPQRHEHLAVPQPVRPNIVLYDGDPATVAVLVAKPFEDPLRGMPLFLRPTLILGQDGVDNPGERIQLRARRRPAPPVPGWHRKRQHLGYRPRVDPKLTRRFPPAQTFNLNRITNLSIELHALHPPAPADCRQRPSAAGVFTPALPDYPAAAEGFLLRRLHLVGQPVPLLQKVDPQHPLQPNRRPAAFALRVERPQTFNQPRPWHHFFHLGQKAVPPRLLFLPGVFRLRKAALPLHRSPQPTGRFYRSEHTSRGPFFSVSLAPSERDPRT